MNLNYYPLFISLEIHHFPSESLNWTDKEINIKYIRNTDTTSQTALMVGLTGMLFFVDIYISNITMTCCYSVALSFFLLPLCRKGRSSELHTFRKEMRPLREEGCFSEQQKDPIAWSKINCEIYMSVPVSLHTRYMGCPRLHSWETRTDELFLILFHGTRCTRKWKLKCNLWMSEHLELKHKMPNHVSPEGDECGLQPTRNTAAVGSTGAVCNRKDEIA